MSQMWIDTQIGDTLIGPSPEDSLIKRNKNMFFYFFQKHYKVLTFFRLKKYYKKKKIEKLILIASR